MQTAPNHFLGDFPRNFWEHFQQSIPSDLRGKSVLDIGCNGGFYSFEMKRRGAARVLGIDHNARYLAQARFANNHLKLDVEFRQLDVYNLDELGDEQFDLVLFLGVLYHLRHPLYALEKAAERARELFVFQTMERGSPHVAELADDYPITERDVFLDDRFPRLYFIEHSYAGDGTNWFVPNRAASEAMLRSAGLFIMERPCNEVYVCRPRPDRQPSSLRWRPAS